MREFQKVACLFPAFAMRYRDYARQDRAGFGEEIARCLERASAVFPINLEKFHQPEQVVLGDPLEDDLQTQYTCYIESCAVGSVYVRQFDRCDYAAGYSMGLFAALAHCGAVSFADGLRILHHICCFAHQALAGGSYGMGVVVGLPVEDVAELITAGSTNVEMADICGPNVAIFSGERSGVEAVLEASLAAGSLQSKLIPVRLPFHTSLLRPIAAQTRAMLDQIEVRSPQRKLLSCISHEVLSSEQEVREEVIRNVSQPMNWQQTIRRLLDLGVDAFLECGMCDSLRNLTVRNVKGSYSIYTTRQATEQLAVVSEQRPVTAVCEEPV